MTRGGCIRKAPQTDAQVYEVALVEEACRAILARCVRRPVLAVALQLLEGAAEPTQPVARRRRNSLAVLLRLRAAVVHRAAVGGRGVVRSSQEAALREREEVSLGRRALRDLQACTGFNSSRDKAVDSPPRSHLQRPVELRGVEVRVGEHDTRDLGVVEVPVDDLEGLAALRRKTSLLQDATVNMERSRPQPCSFASQLTSRKTRMMSWCWRMARARLTALSKTAATSDAVELSEHW